MEDRKMQKLKNGGEDMISRLPEALVSRILSLLPTKDAVRTSILSKRWIRSWESITNLNIDDRVFYSYKNKEEGAKGTNSSMKKTPANEHFLKFVHRALQLTKSSSLQSFSLFLDNHYDYSLQSPLNTWISALDTSLKKLSIHSQNLPILLSSLTSNSLFNSELLEELALIMKFSGSVAGSVTVFTSYIHLGNLKSLKLSRITFKALDHSRTFTLSFPLLQEFVAGNCIWEGATHVTFKVPILQKVVMAQSIPSRGPQGYPIVLEFDASHFTKVTYYCGYISQYAIAFSDHSSLCNANADIIISQYKEEEVPLIFGLLQKFSQVKYLRFRGSKFPTKSTAFDVLPVFEMLNHLELDLVEGVDLFDFLLNSPVLKTLIFKGLVSEIHSFAVVPHCIQHSLEVVEFGGFKGLEHEFCVANFVMKNGLMLKRMSFSVAAGIGKSKAIEEFREKLFSFERGNDFVIIEFSYNN